MSTSEAETKARGMGWLPKEQFRGDPEKWVDAQTFVDRGETFVPYLKANNRRLEEKLNAQSSQISSLQELIKTNNEQIEALLEYNSEFNKQRVSDQRKGIVQAIAQARADGDVAKEVELQDQLRRTSAALEKSDDKPAVKPNGGEVKPTPNVGQPSPEVQAAFSSWLDDHAWYKEDRFMKSAFIGEMSERIKDPEFRKKSLADQFNEVGVAIEERFGQVQPPRRGKYEGGSGGGGPQSRSDGSKGYAELPQDAKDGCARYETKLVGKGKKFETVEAWRAKFAKDYWENA